MVKYRREYLEEINQWMDMEDGRCTVGHDDESTHESDAVSVSTVTTKPINGAMSGEARFGERRVQAHE